MLIYDSEYAETVGTCQIKSIQFPKIIGQTENNESVAINTTKQQQTDVVFWKSISDIMNAEIWIPYNKGTYFLLQQDWILDSSFA